MIAVFSSIPIPKLYGLNDTAVILQYHLPSAENLRKARQMYERAVQLAEQQLADAQTPAARRELVTKAKADALANLAAMK